MGPKKATAGTTATKKSTPSEHPPYKVMITEAILQLKERNGSSRQAIKKYVQSNFKVKQTNFDTQFNSTLRKGVTAGDFVQPKGPSGPVKLQKKEAAKPAAKAKTGEKAATKKASTTTKKAAGTKKAAASTTKAAKPKAAAATTSTKKAATANSKKPRKTAASGEKALKKTKTGGVTKKKTEKKTTTTKKATPKKSKKADAPAASAEAAS